MSDWRRNALIYVGLAVITTAVYWPVCHFEFVNYDDPLYVTENSHVQEGLTLRGVAWALTATHFSIWMPVTWLSCMLDCQLFGLNAGAHHLVNVFFHIANTLLLFVVLNRMTSAPWRSAFVAGLFALHPLHVESVAWVTERKDVLSTFFWMFTMLAYVGYVNQPRAAHYVLMMAAYALGLMSKPMLVTLPFVLLLLDYWPLGRTRQRSLTFLMREKIPLLALTIPACIVTYWAEQRGGSVILLDRLSVGMRVTNAAVSYVRYLGKTLWPTDLAAYYPYRLWSPLAACAATALLASVSVIVIWKAKRAPYLVTGWLWFLGTLVPVIGLVQVGTFSMADRYTYVPLVGLFIMAAWCLPVKTAAAAPALLVVCAVASAMQVRHWKNSETLFRHALAATKDNAIAHENLGKTLAEQGKLREATAEFVTALRLKPDSASAHNNLANALAAQGKFTEATTEFQATLRIKPNSAEAHYNLGVALASQGKTSEAVTEFAMARQIDPDNAEAHYNLGALLANQGRTAEAMVEYREALRVKPNWQLPQRALARTLETPTSSPSSQ